MTCTLTNAIVLAGSRGTTVPLMKMNARACLALILAFVFKNPTRLHFKNILVVIVFMPKMKGMFDSVTRSNCQHQLVRHKKDTEDVRPFITVHNGFVRRNYFGNIVSRCLV